MDWGWCPADCGCDKCLWAERIAASLPPLTPEQARAVGRLAAAIDERRKRIGEQDRT